VGGGRKKLLTVARLFHTDYPRYGRSCEDCRTWKYEKDGRVALDRTKRREDGTQDRDDPAFWLRMPEGVDPPCHDCGKTVGLQVRHWSGVSEPEWWHYRAFRHHQRCKAVNWQTPDSVDPIVQRHAELFDMVAEAKGREDQTGMLLVLGLMAKSKRA